MGQDTRWTSEDESEFNALAFAITSAMCLEDRQPARAVVARWIALHERWQHRYDAKP